MLKAFSNGETLIKISDLLSKNCVIGYAGTDEYYMFGKNLQNTIVPIVDHRNERLNYSLIEHRAYDYLIVDASFSSLMTFIESNLNGRYKTYLNVSDEKNLRFRIYKH